MRSNGSSSTVSSDAPVRRRRRWRNWPETLLLPVLVAAVQALAVTPLLHIFFGPEFGLTGGREVMWPGGIAMLGLAGFWSTRFVAKVTSDPRYFSLVLGAFWMLGAAVWIGLEPVYGLRGLLGEPSSLVGERGYLVAPLLLSLGVWWQGVRYATIEFLFTAEEIRGSTQRSWLVLICSLLFAALINNRAGDEALRSAPLVVPALMIASVALVAAAEIHASRSQISLSGGRPPSWSRWGRLVGGVAAIVLVVALVVTVVLTPGAFAAMIGAILLAIKAVGQVLLWLLYGVFYVLYYAFYAISELFRSLFDVEFGPMQPPQPPEGMQGEPLQLQERGETEPWKYAALVRWGALAVVVIAAVLLLFRMARRPKDDEAEAVGDEERSSVFTADLAKEQLRNLFRRGRKGARLHRLNLDVAPGSVRDAWRYLQVLAVRQDAGRGEAETPQDFAARLRAMWPGTAGSINDLARRYERSRYGDIETDRDRVAAVDDWSDIYRRRRDSDGQRQL